MSDKSLWLVTRFQFLLVGVKSLNSSICFGINLPVIVSVWLSIYTSDTFAAIELLSLNLKCNPSISNCSFMNDSINTFRLSAADLILIMWFCLWEISSLRNISKKSSRYDLPVQILNISLRKELLHADWIECEKELNNSLESLVESKFRGFSLIAYPVIYFSDSI